ncbi:hypothetical protein SH139x_000418 [Planctomycetaceae bacterium SH139]
MAKKNRIPHKFLPWIDVRKRYHLSHAQVQMARELGLSPKNFPSYADRKDQPWKRPLPQFIEMLYEQQFGKSCPDVIYTMEEIAAAQVAKRAARKAANALRDKAAAEALATMEAPSDAETPAPESLTADETLNDETLVATETPAADEISRA